MCNVFYQKKALEALFIMLLSLFLLSLQLPCAAGQNGSTKKTKLSSCDFQMPIFDSRNLNNILTWTAPRKSKGAKYNVNYKSYGQKKWNKIPECMNITRTWCDLTKETRECGVAYYGKVTNVLDFCSNRSERFYPCLKTIIGPPTIILFADDTFIEIKLTHPMNNSKELQYHIYLNDEKIAETENPYYKKEHLKPSTTYCVAASVDWKLEKGIQSNKTCITTNADAAQVRNFRVMVYMIPVILVILSLFALGYFLYKYIYVKNIRQPHILNIRASSNKNVILVEAHTVTVNVISIDGKLNNTSLITDKEEGKAEPEDPSDFNLTDNNTSLDSGITEAGEESDGYRSLHEEMSPPLSPPITPVSPPISPMTPVSPPISPYDMPHYLHKPVGLLPTSSDTAHKGNLYGRIKCSANTNNSIQAKEDIYVVQRGCTSEKSLDRNSYLPHGNFNCAPSDKVIEEPLALEESCTDQNTVIGLNLMADTDPNECSMLFVDWSPDDPHLYIPNPSRKKQLEKCIELCKEEKESLLNELYIPREEVAMAEEDKLMQMKEQWGLLLQGIDS